MELCCATVSHLANDASILEAIALVYFDDDAVLVIENDF